MILFGSSLVGVLIASNAFERKADPTSGLFALGASIAAGTLFAVAFWLLFRKRAFIVDRSRNSLTILERSLLGRKELGFTLGSVRVRVEQVTNTHSYRGGRYEHTQGAIWLDIEGHRPILFMSDLHGPEAKVLGTQLAQDLGCSLICER